MIKEIKYNGFTVSPSDYECPDGDLAGVVNLVPEDGALKPVFPGEKVLSLSEGQDILCIHETAAYKHYIIVDRNGASIDKLLFFNDNDPEIYEMGISLPKNIYKCSPIGNTLVVIADDGFHYILWQENNQSYLYLGQKPDELDISLSMSNIQKESYDRSTIESTDTSKTYYSAWRATEYVAGTSCNLNSNRDSFVFNPDKQSNLTTSIWALINQTNAKISKSGNFYAPFFVRYAYRLYDGNTFMASAPIFMPLCMPKAYHVEVVNAYSNNGIIYFDDVFNIKDENDSSVDFTINHLTFRYTPVNEYILFQLLSSIDNIRNLWGDIIKSIDFFVSLPMVRELSDEPVKTGSIAKESIIYTAGFLTSKSYPWIRSSNASDVCNVVVDIPMLSDEAYLAKIKDVANFYKVYSIPLGSPMLNSTQQQKLPVDGSTLEALATQEVLEDDYKTHNRLLPVVDGSGCKAYCFNYNSRINISGVKEKLFKGFSIKQLAPKMNGQEIIRIDVILQTDEGLKTVSETEIAGRGCERLALYNIPFFYPDNRAIKMIVYTKTRASGATEFTYRSYHLEMKSSDFLNGSFTQGGIFKDGFSVSDSDWNSEIIEVEIPPVQINDIVSSRSKVFTSEVNNPFLFRSKNITTVGTGHILGISTAAKALSQGQFGQFPLYAFTSEGVWALEVSTTTGGYSARQPITRDVCINPDSITQIDSAVLFATDRGIMLLEGSKTTCLSDVLDSTVAFNPSTLPGYDKILSSSGVTAQQIDYIPLKEFIKQGGMIYDYTNQRIIVYNPSKNYAYVFSLKDKAWGMMSSTIKSSVNSYPNALAMDSNGDLVDISTPDASSLTNGINGMIFTRPIKLEPANALKTVDTIIQRGYFRSGHVQQVLYASRDLFNWHLVWSSQSQYLRGFSGTPYKYFRIGIICRLSKDESLYGCTVQYTPRLTNQPR